MLPGADGSTFHFRGLMAWLTGMDCQVLAFDTREFRGHSDVSSFANRILEKVKGHVNRQTHVCVFAYSNAGILINSLSAHFNATGEPWEALILLDPMFSFKKLSTRERVAIQTKMIASSVIDEEELERHEYDWSALRAALLSLFPTYAARFEGFELWQNIGWSLPDAFEQTGIVICPVLLLVAKHIEPMFHGITGGEQCIPSWTKICPQARVKMIDCRHVDIPFTPSAMEESMHFLFSIGGQETLKPAGRKKMQATLQAMTIAQRSFKTQWTKEFRNEQFRLASSVALAEPQAISTLLKQLGWEHLLSHLLCAGYTDANFLRSLEMCDLIKILQEVMCLREQDALNLCDLLLCCSAYPEEFSSVPQ